MTHTASILLFRGVPTYYTYRVPDTLLSSIDSGSHVHVPLGRVHCQGVVMSLSSTDIGSSSLTLKNIYDICDTSPALSMEFIELIDWFVHYYQCTPYKAYQTIVGKRRLRLLTKPFDYTLSQSPFTLTIDQAQVVKRLTASSCFSRHLIHGITGSGKTEIYSRLAAYAVAHQQSIIICCPEISLTPQYTDYFKSRFSDHVVVIHSHLTPKQRDEAWSSIYTQQARIIIGPRSAVFAPASSLAFIVIDEEHDHSYKQESHPRYYTHSVAYWRCRYHQCPLVYGSATPSVESYISTAVSPNKDVPSFYTHLTQRATGSSLPSIELIDMKRVKSGTLLSPHLIKHIQSRLDRHQKVMILLNRRGYSPYVSCQSCHRIHHCLDCGLSYTYHQDKTFRCHRCHYIKPLTHICSYCKKPHLSFGGKAIQKLEGVLHQEFKHASIIRLDKDTAKTAKQMDELLTEFKQTGDILIGTQLIAKGHHIESVTLVGVLGIDTQLNIPDFRAAERAFQLMMQVAGRAGRGALPGHVLIQTNQPEHYSIQCAKTHDYHAFIDHECEYRETLLYPPFNRLTHVIFSSENLSQLKHYCAQVEHYLHEINLPKDLSFIGPHPAPIERIRTHYRYCLLFKHPSAHNQRIRSLLATFPAPSKHIRVIPDFDPQGLL